MNNTPESSQPGITDAPTKDQVFDAYYTLLKFSEKIENHGVLPKQLMDGLEGFLTSRGDKTKIERARELILTERNLNPFLQGLDNTDDDKYTQAATIIRQMVNPQTTGIPEAMSQQTTLVRRIMGEPKTHWGVKSDFPANKFDAYEEQFKNMGYASNTNDSIILVQFSPDVASPSQEALNTTVASLKEKTSFRNDDEGKIKEGMKKVNAEKFAEMMRLELLARKGTNLKQIHSDNTFTWSKPITSFDKETGKYNVFYPITSFTEALYTSVINTIRFEPIMEEKERTYVRTIHDAVEKSNLHTNTDTQQILNEILNYMKQDGDQRGDQRTQDLITALKRTAEQQHKPLGNQLNIE